NPQRVVIIAAGCALNGIEMFAAIVRAVERSVRDIDSIRVARVGSNAAKIPAALPDAVVGGNTPPRTPFIVGTVQAASTRIHQSKHPSAVTPRCDRNSDAAHAFIWESVPHDLMPRNSAVRRFVEAAAGTTRWRINAPRRAARLPQRRVDDLRVARIKTEVNGAGVVILAENFFPRGATIDSALHTTLGIGSKPVTQRGN